MDSPIHELGLSQSSPYAATLIISVYTDVLKLKTVLYGISCQSIKNFEVIVSEDGESTEMAAFLAPYLGSNPALKHLTQADKGFRKTRALNRAIRASRSDYLIFIDGDCVPHPDFVANHIAQSEPGTVCVGRRIELGLRYSELLINTPTSLSKFTTTWSYLLRIPAIMLDGGKNPESGLYAPWTNRFLERKRIGILGCNFSCSKSALQKINGFNEDYESVGTGEDSDIDWRFTRAGFENKNVKFLTPLFHLYHPRSLPSQSPNSLILEKTQNQDLWFCENGLDRSSI